MPPLPDAMTIITHTPIWAWLLIGYALYAGWNSTKSRIVSPIRLFMMPAILTGLCLYRLFEQRPSPVILLSFGAAAVVGALIGQAIARRRPVQWLGNGKVAVAGDWLPLVLIICIITIRYAEGIAVGVVPALALNQPFILLQTTLSGFFATLLLVRTVGILLAFRTASAQVADRP
jgi:hypothetical protein